MTEVFSVRLKKTKRKEKKRKEKPERQKVAGVEVWSYGRDVSSKIA